MRPGDTGRGARAGVVQFVASPQTPLNATACPISNADDPKAARMWGEEAPPQPLLPARERKEIHARFARGLRVTRFAFGPPGPEFGGDNRLRLPFVSLFTLNDPCRSNSIELAENRRGGEGRSGTTWIRSASVPRCQ